MLRSFVRSASDWTRCQEATPLLAAGLPGRVAATINGRRLAKKYRLEGRRQLDLQGLPCQFVFERSQSLVEVPRFDTVLVKVGE